MHPAGKGSCLDKVFGSLVFFEIFCFFGSAGRISREARGLLLDLWGGDTLFSDIVGSPFSHLRIFFRGPASFVAFLFCL